MGVKFGFLLHWQNSLWMFGSREMKRNLELGEKKEYRKLHDKLHNLKSSPNIIVIKSRMQKVGHIACIREMYTKLWLESLKWTEHPGDPAIDEMLVYRNKVC